MILRLKWIGVACALSACGIDVLGTLPSQRVIDSGVPDASPSSDAARESNEVTLDAAVALRPDVVALYTFVEADGTTVRDVSGVLPALDLVIEGGGQTRWDPAGLTLFGTGARLSTNGGATKISSACKAANALSLEAWVQPAIAAQGGPARIATVSNGPFARNMTLGVGEQLGNLDSRYVLRVGTKDDPNWGIVTPSGEVRTAMQHVVATAKFPGVARIYVDAVERAATPLPSDLSQWTEGFPLALGGELTVADRRFLGTYALVAIFCKELSPQEVVTNQAAGPPRR